jgi:hypothetical protein
MKTWWNFEPTDLKLVDVPISYSFGGVQLLLKATINKSLGHFTSWIKKSTSWVFYDGMRNQKFEEVEASDFKKIEKVQLGYNICCLIYEISQEKTFSCFHDNLSTNLAKTPSLTSIQKELKSSFFKKNVDKLPSSKGKLQHFTSTPRKKKRKAFGFTYAPQSSNMKTGKNPICRGCNFAIEKEEPRITHIYVENGKFQYASQHIYHVKLACLRVLKPVHVSFFCDKKWAQEDVRKIVSSLQQET